MKVTLAFSAIFAMAGIVSAGTPACLLAALGQQEDPSDVSSLCNKYQSAMLGNITEVCSDSDLTAAYESYASTCKSKGVTVSKLPSESSSSSSTSATSSASKSSSGSSTVSATTTASSSGSASASASASAAASATDSSSASATSESSDASASSTGTVTAGGFHLAPSMNIVLAGLVAAGVAGIAL